MFYFAEFEVLTARLVNTKLPSFRPLWCVTVYVIGRQTAQLLSALERVTVVANQYHRGWISGLTIWSLGSYRVPRSPEVLPAEAFFGRFRVKLIGFYNVKQNNSEFLQLYDGKVTGDANTTDTKCKVAPAGDHW